MVVVIIRESNYDEKWVITKHCTKEPINLYYLNTANSFELYIANDDRLVYRFNSRREAIGKFKTLNKERLKLGEINKDFYLLIESEA